MPLGDNLGSARAPRAGDGALAIANFPLGAFRRGRRNVHASARALPRSLGLRQHRRAAAFFDFAQDDAASKLVKLKNERVSLHSRRRAHGL